MIADMAGLRFDKVLAAVGAAPLSFFPHARGSGHDWKIPERDVWDWLRREEWMSLGTFAERTDYCTRTIKRHVQAGTIRAELLLGEPRIPRSELYRLLSEGVDKPRRRFSFLRDALSKEARA